MHISALPLAACLLTLALPLSVRAQTASPSTDPQTSAQVQPSRTNQTIERIRVEDKGSRIDELRVGGQTQNITVQPKNDMPAYEVRPASPHDSNAAGKRMWNFGKF